MEAAMWARNVPGVQEQLKSGKVAVAGLGGLGSHIAVMLARIGVGKLLLVDFDRVELSNLNRQHYDLSHIGLPKAVALKIQLEAISPFVEIETNVVKVTQSNALEIFRGYPVVCEAFDAAENKAMLVNALLEGGEARIVAASGMAGVGSANAIQTRQVMKNLYICGDSAPSPYEHIGFMAPRVMVCAGHQANMAARLLMDMESP